MTAEYSERIRLELEHFREVENVHDLPAIFHVWSEKYVRPKILEVIGMSIAGMEDFYARYIRTYAEANPRERIHIASIGAGNGDLEVRIAKLLKAAGIEQFRFQCLDINPAMLERGREAARNEQLMDHFDFLEEDTSNWSPAAPIAIVMANHSLHHILELESTFAKIKHAIGRKGYFLTCDMIGRNGHMRWPEALEHVERIWQTMPDRYKYNHQLKRYEQMYENFDCSTEGFEGIRAQDILPLLVRFFSFDAFVAYGNIPDVFVERSFGHNFDPANPDDVRFVDYLGELNDKLISDGKIKPTQMMAVMRASSSRPCKHYLHWTPEFCVRPPHPSLPFPVTGCGIQQGPARGFWDDGWIGTEFYINIWLELDLDRIEIDAYLPENLRHPPEVSIRFNEVAVCRQKTRPGPFSVRIPARERAHQLLRMRIDCDRSYSPVRQGHGADARELGMIIREIRLIRRNSSRIERLRNRVVIRRRGL